MKRAGKILGIALGPSGALVAEVSGDGKRKVVALGEFAFPAGTGIERAEELGKALGAFLKKSGISEKDTVIGLPAKWLLTRRKELPPASAAVAEESLRLQAESEFAGDHDLVVDYAGKASSSAASSVLLVATSKTYIAGAEAMAKAAGLKLRGITASGVALGKAVGAMAEPAGVMLSVSSAGTELVVQQEGVTTQLRHLTVSEDAGVLAGEIRRNLVGLSLNGDGKGLSMWGLGESGLGVALSERLSMRVTAGNVGAMARAEGPPVDGRYAPAVAVALGAMDGMAVDFLDSRLAPPVPVNNKKWIQYAVIAGVAVVGLIVAGYVDIYRREAKVEEVKAKIAVADATLKTTGPIAARVRTARDYIASSTDYTACLSDLTKLFPNDQAVWAMKLSLSTDAKGEMKGELSYRAPQAGVATELLRQMRDHRNFADIWQKAIDTDKKTGDVTYALSFTYKVGGNTTLPATKGATTMRGVIRRPEIPAATKPAETGPAESKPAESMPAATKADAKPAATQAVAATVAATTRAAESKPAETRPQTEPVSDFDIDMDGF